MIRQTENPNHAGSPFSLVYGLRLPTAAPGPGASANRVDDPEKYHSAYDGNHKAPEIEARDAAAAQEIHHQASDEAAYNADNDIFTCAHLPVVAGNHACNPSGKRANDQPPYNAHFSASFIPISIRRSDNFTHGSLNKILRSYRIAVFRHRYSSQKKRMIPWIQLPLKNRPMLC
jgi:hypothetical protein